MKKYSKHDQKLLVYGIGISTIFLILGALFLVNAMGIASFYKNFAAIDNALGKYIVVILTFTCGIMGWCNVALRFEAKNLRNGFTIGMTAFAFIMTLPLTYVLIAELPMRANHSALEISQAGGYAGVVSTMTPDQVAASGEALGLNAIDKVMGTHNIYLGIADWFGEGAFSWVVLIFLAILGVVFLAEPLAAGICVCKGKILNIFGADDNGKKGLIKIATLPVVKKQKEEQAQWIKEHIV